MTIPTWIRGTALLVLTFSAGVFSGITFERRQAPVHDSTTPASHDAMHHLARELDLDAAQQAKLSEILSRHQAEVDTAWHALQPHMRATLDSTAKEILALLRPDQAEKYRQMMDAMHHPPR